MAMAAPTTDLASLFEDFSRYFEVSLARTPSEKRSVYRVRYKVYCESFGFENAQEHQDGCESDGFDDHSLHCLVTHRATGMPAGCVRLVTVDADTKMPIEVHCRDSLDQRVLRGTRNRRGHVAEISRLAVDAPFCRHRRAVDPGPGAASLVQFDAREQRTFRLISVSLFLAAGAVADLLRRTDCFALMEPFLRVMLKRAGINVQRVGADLEYRGTRAPYHLDIDDAVRSLPDALRMCYENIRGEFEAVLFPSAGSFVPVSPVADQDVISPLGSLLNA